MKIKYFVDKEIIPDDGSYEMLHDFEERFLESDTEILIFPDVHYKKGATVLNGMLTADKNNILPSMLGVANCGFSFGLLENVSIKDREQLENSFQDYSKILANYRNTEPYSFEYILELFQKHFRNNLAEEQYKTLEYLGIKTAEQLTEVIEKVLTDDMKNAAVWTLGTLGGGNHFFELHYIEEVIDDTFGIVEGDIIFILHTDSVALGNKINLLFSNLSELANMTGPRGILYKGVNRLRQLVYFVIKNQIALKEAGELSKLLFNKDNCRTISANMNIGRLILLSFTIASMFGDINRNVIIEKYFKMANKKLQEMNIRFLGSHSHDSICVDTKDNDIRIIQRNGVQWIDSGQLYVLPGALGTDSYIMKNSCNKDAYCSANHGVGRILDKHLAKDRYSTYDTEAEIYNRGMRLYRIGSGDIAEQHPYAFKDVSQVIKTMEKYELGYRVAKLRPISSIKG